MASEENKHSDMLHLPPILPRYNYDILNSLDDIYIEEIREDHFQWNNEFLSVSPHEEIIEEINVEVESQQEPDKFDNLFASSLKNDTWNCPICLDIFEDPVETPCCHNLFCEKCVEPVLKCPICKKMLLRCVPNIPIKRLIQELSVKCRHSLCDKIVKKGFLNKHEALCEMALMKCCHSSTCGEIVRKDIKTHLNELCPYRPTKCTLECGSILKFLDLEDHISSICPNAVLTCPQDCGASLLRKEILEHYNSLCPNTPVKCQLFDYFGTVCGAECLRKDLKEHQLTCNFREVRCGNSGCKERIMYQYLQDHEDICKYKIIQCLNGCDASFLRKEEGKHKESCQLEVIECSYKIVGCGVKVVRKNFELHLNELIKEHEAMMLKAYTKHHDLIKRFEDELQDLKSKTANELIQMKELIKVQRNAYFDYNVNEEIPNPFNEILKQ